MKSRRVVAGAVMAVLVVGGAAGADAAQKRAAEVEVSIEKTPSTIEGKVSSSKDSCKSNVVVRLFWKSGGVWQNVARDETTDAGRYKISGPGGNVPPGKYYSLVKAKAGCDRAKSETIRVGSVG